MDPVDLRLLESFVAVAEELHFTRAAERLHIAQPALSQQITRLERQVGTALFTRRPGPVTMTPAGAELLERARPALRQLRAAVTAAREVADGRSGTLAVGHLSSFGPRVVPALTASLAVRHPGLRIEAREASVEEQLAGLHAGTLDLGLFYLDRDVGLDDDAVLLEPLASGPHYVALPPGHPLAARAEVPLEELRDATWVMPSGTGVPGYQSAVFVAVCARHGFSPRVGRHANSIETMLGMVGAGLGLAPAPWTVLLRPPGDVAFARTPGETFDAVAATLDATRAGPAIAAARDVLADLLVTAEPTAR